MQYAHRLMRGTITRLARPGALLVALLIVIAGCSSGTATETTVTTRAVGQTTTNAPPAAETTTTTVATTTTTVVATTTTSDGPTVNVGAGVDQATVDQLVPEVNELISATEQLRGLEFLTHPTITILTTNELSDRVAAQVADELVPEEIAVEGRVYQLVGLLEPGDDLNRMLVDLYSEGVAGFYDGDTGELVIGGEAADLTPYTKDVIVHELVHALTDQHFLFNDDYQAMFDEQRYDEGAAFQALIEGDATYFQILYLQQMPLAEQMSAAQEEFTRLQDAPSYTNDPAWLLNSLAFPYDTGRTFVADLIDSGGIAAVDKAYTNRPVSTEVVMHPARYESGEGVLAVPSLDISIDGFETLETSTYGEEGIRELLTDSPPGVAVEAANGWGGDQYQILYNDSDVVMALEYKGDTEEDAYELADALQGLVTSLDFGDPVGSGGGVAYNAEDGRYAYLNRIGDGFIFVISTDATAGAAAVDQMHIP
jgi:hypothetical protein